MATTYTITDLCNDLANARNADTVDLPAGVDDLLADMAPRIERQLAKHGKAARLTMGQTFNAVAAVIEQNTMSRVPMPMTAHLVAIVAAGLILRYPELLAVDDPTVIETTDAQAA